ncbi:MAG TPA: tripartite tricarboxylate transporter substrate binding protein, partial [Casimicrobiaceae bacterium]|nr:tripartite tricarboxylate transporter substrate binding protein [Casimicrobiaceae bacterium]
VRLVVPFTPGGSTDILARAVGQKLSESWGQPVVVDNRPGAGGIIGMETVAKSAPDGYTLVMGHIGTLAANPALYKTLPYDPVKDFAPVTLIARVPNVLVVGPAVPSRSVAELIALAKAKPGKLDYGSGGNGSAAHLATEYFKLKAGVDLQHIPYKGTAPALQDLLGGQIALMITGLPPVLPHVKAGKLRILGVASAQRLRQFPEIPTIAESGVPGFEATQWYGILAPAATPKEIVAKLNREFVKALRDPAVGEKLAGEGADPVGDTPGEFAAFIASEIDLWGKVIRATGAKAE